MLPILTLAAAMPALGQAKSTVRLFREYLTQRVLLASGTKQAEKPAAQVRLARAEVEVCEAELLMRHTVEDVCTRRNTATMADPTPFLAQLAEVGIDSHVETETLGFDFEDFASAWELLAKVTTTQLAPERQQDAKAAVMAAMWPQGDGPRHFRNVTQFIVGQRR